MTSALMMERTGMGMPGMGMPSMGSPLMTPSSGTMPGSGWVMVPRCTLKVEKCSGGMKLTCSCDDALSCSTLQNLCTMLAGGLCGCCCTLNGMTVYTCSFTMGMCKCEMTDKGVCITCTSGDAKCCDMIQACCDCLNSLLASGCTCCVTLNNMPVGCGCTESACATSSTTKGSSKK